MPKTKVNEAPTAAAMAKQVRGTTVSASGAVLEMLIAKGVQAERDRVAALAKSVDDTARRLAKGEYAYADRAAIDGYHAEDAYPAGMWRALRILRGEDAA